MKQPMVCLVTGPAGVGKSTVTKELASKFTNSARIEVDYVRRMVVGGYVAPFQDSKKTGSQILLSQKNACSLAKNFVEHGFCVFIDDVVRKKSSLDYYLKNLNNYNVFIFLLFCDKDVLQKRDTARSKEQVMGERAMRMHDFFSKRLDEKRWIILDTSKYSIAKTVEKIIDIIEKNS